MKTGDIIKQVKLEVGKNIINLDRIYPLKLDDFKGMNTSFYVNKKPSAAFDTETIYADTIEIECSKASKIDILLGKGYYAEKDEKWTSWFNKKQRWAGGDGIYSFNLTNGRDQFDQKEKATNLFVFGDTLVGRVDELTKRRYEPLLMPNNSLAYLDKDQETVKFHLNTTEKDSVTAFFSIDPKYDVKGTLPQNLVTYDQKQPNDGWLSGFNPKYLWLVFDLAKKTKVTDLEIVNYFSHESKDLSSRGVRIFQLFGSDNEIDWTFVGEYKVEQSFSASNVTRIKIDQEFRYFKFDINPSMAIGNYDENWNEG
ncbi:MAG: discoidin domain-containing protein, partial [Bacilli bacterium]|nr:discoidin domain-containing protein [Bacilli bacterium]